METKKSVKHTEVIQLDTDDKTIVAALESPNLSSEDTVDNNGISGIDASADVVETDIEPEIYPIAKRLTKSALRRMNSLDYAGNKNLAEGLMDIALLSANANQLRFLLTYNNKAPTYYISLGLRHLRKNDRRYIYIKELLIFGIFIITVVNVLIAAFTTTESDDKA
ncbi:ninjurin-B isoform X2 [Zeugodacus cucurbitae]|uniref:ninjurin-B isoform X2 n=1 Tax=Zeugodacus cucurbitae TaxID=28588 RepID=UPI0005969901|nr:ninjurin-B isoform X2 [Zeugodacus cucurbitae]